MSKFKKYSRYKEFENYIGDIPEEWNSNKFKVILQERNMKNKPIISKERLSLSIDKGVTLYAEKTTNLDRFKEDFTQYKIAYPKDLVLNSMNVIVGAAGVSKYLGCVSPAYYVFYSSDETKYLTDYYYYFFKTSKMQKKLYSIGRGIMAIDRGNDRVNTCRLKVSKNDLKNLIFPVPKINEQYQIVKFIKFKEKQINKLIKKQKKLIKLLKEQKSVIINEAVTKGIDKTAQMKDSGIKWLTQIPQHWEIKRTKFVAKSFAKGNGITKDDVILNGDIRCIRYGEIYSKYDVQVLDCVSSTNIDIINSPRYISNGDILFAGTGELVEEIGKNVVYMGSEPCLAGGDIIIMKHKQDALFINYALNSKYAQAQKSFGKVKLKVVHISAGNIGNIRIALPPIEEQKKIAEYLNEKCSKINEIILQKEQIITKLIEYKTSLISNAVTGQIDVRDYEIPKINDVVDLEEIENISEDDTEIISEVEYANN